MRWPWPCRQWVGVIVAEHSYLIFGEGFHRHAWAELAKRSTDVLFVLITLVLFWPFILATWVIVRLGSPGPALFSQERIGLNGEPFILMMFRSMRIDAEGVCDGVGGVLKRRKLSHLSTPVSFVCTRPVACWSD
ncbi:MAG: sugar transferase [Planctomycetes bacterium]|nr:sugar transferase [Planctomycetota bacterium]